MKEKKFTGKRMFANMQIFYISVCDANKNLNDLPPGTLYLRRREREMGTVITPEPPHHSHSFI